MQATFPVAFSTQCQFANCSINDVTDSRTATINDAACIAGVLTNGSNGLQKTYVKTRANSHYIAIGY